VDEVFDILLVFYFSSNSFQFSSNSLKFTPYSEGIHKYQVVIQSFIDFISFIR
jgi:hypothetical protein